MKVRIGALDYPVLLATPEDEGWGEYQGIYYPDSHIELAPDQFPSLMASTLLHECLHGIFTVYGIVPAGQKQENLCLALEGPLLAFIRDNPGVIKAIQQAAKGVPLPLDWRKKD